MSGNQRRLVITNFTQGTTLGETIEVADTSRARNKGLLGRTALPSGGGLWIVPCQSVHTFWMKFPLDLVYIDRHNRVRKVRRAVPAWRISACLSAHSVLELPAGAIAHSRTTRGDLLAFVEHP
jgi:hypothetical protein